ncbi:MAG TPA: hypothetical protein VLT47_06180 [Anaeromyxobacteraceae bacterium]|nr:hypothetical protein [Anaeromyxobacteraceae bacterium]
MKTLVAALAALFVISPAVAQTVGDVQIGGGNPFLMKKATDHVARVKGTMKDVLARVEEARNEKDIVKLNCVNEKLAQIKQILNVAEGAEIALQEAVAKGDPGADAEYSKIAIARGKADQLKTEAEECIGQLAFVVDEKTSVEVQQPEDLPPEVRLSGDSFGGVTAEEKPAEPQSIGKAADVFGNAFAGGSFFAPPPPVRRPYPASPYF